jgi:hypothetical protein
LLRHISRSLPLAHFLEDFAEAFMVATLWCRRDAERQRTIRLECTAIGENPSVTVRPGVVPFIDNDRLKVWREAFQSPGPTERLHAGDHHGRIMLILPRFDDAQLKGGIEPWQRFAGKWATGTTGQNPCALVDIATIDFKRFFDMLQRWPKTTVFSQCPICQSAVYSESPWKTAAPTNWPIFRQIVAIPQYVVYEGVIPAAQHRAISKLARKTSHIERFNNTLRQRVSRLGRDALSFSKNLAHHMGAIELFICHYNLTRAVA